MINKTDVNNKYGTYSYSGIGLIVDLLMGTGPLVFIHAALLLVSGNRNEIDCEARKKNQKEGEPCRAREVIAIKRNG